MTISELKERQSWELSEKIDHSLGVIDLFLSRLDNKCYVSFSGGKDSTVLLDLCRLIRPDIKAVFCNTGNEYPDIIRFVKQSDNVEIIQPKLKPKEVISKYGFPLISKEVSENIERYRINPNSVRGLRAIGAIKTKYRANVPSKYISIMKSNEFGISAKCCQKLKKDPFLKYEKATGLSPIVGIMASESNMRTTMYVKQGGCNSFSERRAVSKPLSIWTEKDIWDYINMRQLRIADIYLKGAKRTGCMFCGYGCQFKNDNRLQMLLDLYPKAYKVFMNYTNRGVTYKQAMRKILSVNKLYLPDEAPANLFEQ